MGPRIGIGMFSSSLALTTHSPGSARGWRCEAQGPYRAQQEGVLVVKDWPGLAAPFALSILGTGGWVISWCACASRSAASAPRREWIPLVFAAVFLSVGIRFRGEPSPSAASSLQLCFTNRGQVEPRLAVA